MSGLDPDDLKHLLRASPHVVQVGEEPVVPQSVDVQHSASSFSTSCFSSRWLRFAFDILIPFVMRILTRIRVWVSLPGFPSCSAVSQADGSEAVSVASCGMSVMLTGWMFDMPRRVLSNCPIAFFRDNWGINRMFYSIIRYKTMIFLLI